MNTKKSPYSLAVGEAGKILGLRCEENMRRRFLDLGFLRGEEVRCVGKSPLGDPRAYLIRGKTVALRQRDAEGITLE